MWIWSASLPRARGDVGRRAFLWAVIHALCDVEIENIREQTAGMLSAASRDIPAFSWILLNNLRKVVVVVLVFKILICIEE